MFQKPLIALALSSCALAASAHQLWLERDAAGPARVYVGDVDDAPDTGAEVAKIAATTTVFRTDPAQPLALSVHNDHLEAAVSGAGDVRMFNDNVWKPWTTKEGVTKLAVFNAREGRSETRAALPYEFVPVATGSDTFTLGFRGQPVAGKAVTVVNPGKWSKHLKTDAQGRVTVPVGDKGRYVLIAAHSVDEARTVAGQQVSKVDYTATLSFVAR